MKILKIILIGLFFQTLTIAQKPNKNVKPYPYGNPVVTHMYTADASPRVLPDGRMWMVTSVDSEEGGGYPTMHKYHTFSTADMKTWLDHGPIFNIDDIMPKDVKKQDWALWAPDMIYRDGKYYLYYPVWIHHTDSVRTNGTPGRVVTSYIGVAVSDAPDKHFKVLNPKIEGTSGIDPAVFEDNDGTFYLLWGHQKIAKLKDNMMELDTKAQELDLGTKRFMEAIWLHKKNEKYYISYHTKYGNKIDKDNPDDPNRDKSEIAYSYADNILGPYTYGGVVNYELGVNVNNGPALPGKSYVPWRLTQSNHVGIAEYHGQDYLFYHTSALSSWRQDEFKNMGTWTQRSVCIDKLDYTNDGSIIPVYQTLEGVPSVKINQPFAVSLKKELALNIEAGKPLVFKNINLGTGYYFLEFGISSLNGIADLEFRLNSPTGKLIGTYKNVKKGHFIQAIRGANGLQDIYVVLKNNNSNAVATFNQLDLIAGAPKGKSN
jgi:arabinoxylan arabinofuranohydrolase